jgi:hypothetical protein
VYLCIHQQNHFLDQTNTHKTVLKKKNIRRDGKRRFVNLHICVFTNKITASLSSTRKPFCATHFPSPLNRKKLAECVVAGNLARLRRLWRCIPLAKYASFIRILSQPWSPPLLGRRRRPDDNAEVDDKPRRQTLSAHLVLWLRYQRNDDALVDCAKSLILIV